MRRVQRRGHLGDDVAGPGGRQGAAGIEQFAHVAARHVAHRDEQDAVGLARLEDGDDVRVINGRRGPGLTDEALPERAVEREPGCEDLQRDVAVQADVQGTVDDRHPAPADLLLDAVSRYLGPGREVGPGLVSPAHFRVTGAPMPQRWRCSG